MSIRLGANPIIWSNDDMRELGAETSLETCLEQARRIGFEGMELGHKFPRDPARLAAVLDRFGLSCVSGWYSAELLARDARAELQCLRPHLKLLKAVGSSTLVLAEVSGAVHGERERPLSSRPRLKAGEWREFGQRVTELARMTAAEGIRLAYHHHMGTVVQNGEDIDALMDATGAAAGLLLDTGHASFAGVDPVSLAQRYAERIVHVHAKDVRAAVRAGVFTVPGDGCVNFAEVFRALRGYRGWVVLEAEQDPAMAEPFKYASLGYDNLRRLLSENMP